MSSPASWFDFKVAGVVFVPLLFLVPLLTDGYTQYVVNLVFVYVVIGMGLNFLLGYAGQFAFANAAFMAIGAYTTAILSSRFDLPFWLCLPASGIAAAALGSFGAFPAMRMRSIYLALVTFAFAELTVWVILNWPEVTRGSNGISVPPAEFFGWRVVGDRNVYYVIMIVTLAMYWIARWILQSRIGRAFVAVRENELVAQCSGISVSRTKLVAFALSAFYSGIGGALYAITVGYVIPSSFGILQLVVHLAIVVLGGPMSLYGSVIGAVLLTALPEALRDFQSLQEIIYGLVLILVVIFMPRGIAGLLKRYRILPREVFVTNWSDLKRREGSARRKTVPAAGSARP